ncbi:Bcr/CflA family efflux MFS transporter [Ureibacillus composti]|nr:Bcr/CflA family efflux MFS transporter [Ureibacillus composti]
MTQPYLKKWGFVAFITSLSMIPPLATDLYMPALPEMVTVFNTTTTKTSLTMTIFFVCMAIGILLFGTLSDKFGRKPMLITAILLTFLFSVACSFAPTITFLIIARAIQALGAGGMVSIASALIKDSFDGKEMSQVLSITQSLGMLAPMLAPLLGALILTYFDWRKTFIALAILNFFSFAAALLLKETLPQEKRTNGGIFQSIWSITKVLKNKTFTSYLLIGSILTAPFMAYIAVASYVYVNGFGISESAFSIYFAITSALAVVGPLLYMKIGSQSFKKTYSIIFTVIMIVGILLLTIGKISPILFLISFVPFPMASMFFRPMISGIILQSQSTNIGAAAAMMNFGFTIVGSLAMLIGSLEWASYVNGIAITILSFALISLIILLISKSRSWISI